MDYKKCNDFDLDLPKKNKSRLVIRDIGYSSGSSVLPINTVHIITESDCGDIRRLIKKVDTVGEQILNSENKSVKRKRRYIVKRKYKFPPKTIVINSFDARSDDSDEEAYKFYTATDDQELLCNSVLGLDVNSDAPSPSLTLSMLYGTAETLSKSDTSKQFDSSTLPKWNDKSELHDTILRREETFTLTEGMNIVFISDFEY